MSIKAKPSNLSSSEDGSAGKRFNYTTTLSIEHTLVENFFQTVKQNLMPGDEISVRHTEIKGRLGRMFAMLVLVVTEVTATSVKVEQIGETLEFEHKDVDKKKIKPLSERYASEGWTMKAARGGLFTVLNEKGKPVATKQTEADAKLIVSGNKSVILEAA